MTKVHLITLVIVDLDDIGAQSAAEILENANYPNDSISPTVLTTETRVVEWHDRHPLNITTTARIAALELFERDK